MPRDYRVFLDDIVEATSKVLEYTSGLSYEQFSVQIEKPLKR